MNKEDGLFTYEEVSRLAKRLEEETIDTRQELTKYKMAFEILKDNINMELICSNHDFLCKPVYALDVYANKQIELTKEESKLLEELMKSEI